MHFYKMLFIGLYTPIAFANSAPHAPSPTIVEPSTDTEIPFQPEGIPYEIKFKGTLTHDVLNMMKEVSYLIRLQDHPPSSFSGLGKRAEKDKKRFKSILRSFGYFNGDVSFRISAKEKDAIVKFKIKLGPRYKIAALSLEAIDNPNILQEAEIDLTYDILGVKPGDRVKVEKIKDAAKKLRRYLQDHGYPFVNVKKPYAYVDHKKREMIVTFPVETGILAIIRETHLKGLKNVESAFVQNRIKWKTNDLYSLKAIEISKQRLSETQLISNIDVKPRRLDNAPLLNDKGHPEPRPIAMDTDVTEGPPRAIGAGLRFATSEGLGGRAFWHNNNLFGGQEHLGISYRAGKRQKRFKLEFDIPDVFDANQNWKNEFIMLWDKNRAYSGRIDSIASRIERPIVDELTASVGFAAEKAKLTQEGFTRSHKMYGLPMEVRIDTTKNKLDPSSGIRASGILTPYTGTMFETKRIAILKTRAALYIPFSRNELGDAKTLLALFGQLGTIFIHNNKSIPFNKRYYGGGAGSVRAYGFQLLGPLNNDRVPVGGRSLLELGAEWRFRFTETLGMVVFVEGGAIGTRKVPPLKKKTLLWGPGIGFRYYTSFAPIRVDLAFPAKRRKIEGKVVDSPFQFYVSIGQAF